MFVFFLFFLLIFFFLVLSQQYAPIHYYHNLYSCAIFFCSATASINERPRLTPSHQKKTPGHISRDPSLKDKAMFASARWGPVKLLPTLAVCNSHHNILASARHFFRPPSRAFNQNDDFVCGDPFRHMTLYEAEAGSPSTGANKPLVLLFQWLYAKPHEVRKYCALYHEIGLDVLAVRGKISHFLWLPEGVKLAAELFCYLERHRPPNEKLLVHASSLGAYNYTITLMATENEASKEYQNFRERVVGQIFDSIVIGTYEDMSEGLSEVIIILIMMLIKYY